MLPLPKGKGGDSMPTEQPANGGNDTASSWCRYDFDTSGRRSVLRVRTPVGSRPAWSPSCETDTSGRLPGEPPCLVVRLPAQRTPMADGDTGEVTLTDLLAQISKAKATLTPRPATAASISPRQRSSSRTLTPIGVVRYVTQFTAGRLFDDTVKILRPLQFNLWDEGRVLAPPRTWPSQGSAAVEFHDTARQGLPEWLPTNSRKGKCFPPAPRLPRACSRPKSRGATPRPRMVSIAAAS